MRFFASAVLISLFATSAICAPVAAQEPGSSIVARMMTDAELTRAYHTAEDNAKAALRSAEEMKCIIGVNKQPTAEQKKKLKEYLTTAFTEGHKAENYRGDFITTSRKSDDARKSDNARKSDDAHNSAIQHINDNIMRPAENMAKLFHIDLH